jgi:P-type Cu+ transporter
MATQATHDQSPHSHGGEFAPSGNAVTDPVCGMTVDPRTAKHSHTYDGRSYYFCSGKCREKFVANPEQYVNPRSGSPDPETVQSAAWPSSRSSFPPIR